MAQYVINVAVTVETSLDQHAAADAIMFHLGVTDLDSVEADVSATTVLSARVVAPQSAPTTTVALSTRRPSTVVTATRKLCQVVGTATAEVVAVDATYDEVLDAGLTALGETRSSLFGYGIKRLHRRDAPVKLTGSFTVYADRD